VKSAKNVSKIVINSFCTTVAILARNHTFVRSVIEVLACPVIFKSISILTALKNLTNA
jgi:hypothetical protein